ncbi:CHASE domain-containing protein [Vibrio mediterranei]|uniref:CHASE domain-containing protein n=1 Tax=Vibrio mediterranei TaxID=689 RepID=UPI00148B9DEA|nr:CHASE domain-containing protein [Vibrio mediterranei]NOI26507.1 diguanylate cyclase [Vibrio mediterranei]
MYRLSSFWITLIALCGLSFSVAFGLKLEERQRTIVQEEVKRATASAASRIQKELSVNFESLYVLRALFDHGKVPSEQVFTGAAQEIIARHPNIQALEWVPKVEDNQRKWLEENKQKANSTFRFTSLNADNILEVAPKKEVYFPVYYVEPYVGNEAALGFDLSSSTTRLATILEAQDTGRMTATKSIQLVQEHSNQKGFLVFLPVYQNSPNVISTRRANLIGFILGVYKIGDIVSSAVTPSSLFHFSLHDVSDSELGHELLYTENDRTYNLPTPFNEEVSSITNVLGRSWELRGSGLTSLLELRRDYSSFAFMGAGIFLTILASLLLIMLKNSSLKVRELVEERTLELSNANKQLKLLSNIDGLTGIANRRHFDEKYAELLALSKAKKTPVTLLIIDIDDFKAYNDCFGHIEGDESLFQ